MRVWSAIVKYKYLLRYRKKMENVKFTVETKTTIWWKLVSPKRPLISLFIVNFLPLVKLRFNGGKWDYIFLNFKCK